METVLQANIFFYITSVAVVAVTVLVIVILFYVLSIVRNVKLFSDKLKRGSDLLSKDLGSLRKSIKEEGARAKQAFASLTAFVPKRRARRKKSESDLSDKEE